MFSESRSMLGKALTNVNLARGTRYKANFLPQKGGSLRVNRDLAPFI